MKPRTAVAAALFFALGALPASASVVLDFSGLDNSFFDDGPLNYYAGGLSLKGNGPGPDYGVTFTPNAFTCGTGAFDICNGIAQPPAPGNLLLFGDDTTPPPPGTLYTMNVAGGFSSAFSFYYNNVSTDAQVDIYSGLNGTGALLASIELPSTNNLDASACGGILSCVFVPAGASFAGIALSVDFSDAKNAVSFANLTLGVPQTSIPEPMTLALFGAGLVGAFGRRRK